MAVTYSLQDVNYRKRRYFAYLNDIIHVIMFVSEVEIYLALKRLFPIPKQSLPFVNYGSKFETMTLAFW